MPLLWISLFFLAGLVLGSFVRLPAAGWLSFSAFFLAAWPLLYRQKRFPRLNNLARRDPRLFLPPILLAAALFLGAWRMAAAAPNAQNGHIIAYNDAGTARITALVVAPPDRGDKSTMLRLKVEEVTPLGEDGQPGKPRPAHGLVQVLLPPGASWQYGDRLALEGAPQTPPEDEDFSYRDYLARKNIYTYLTFPRVRLLERNAGNPLLAEVYRMREWAYTEIYHLFPAPEAPLLAGILLGIDRDLPEHLERAFQDTGTAHVIAISGFNIAILINLFMKMFSRVVSRWWAMAAAILAICIYTILVGGTPSVVRAAWMGSMALIADQIGRRSTGANSLGFTAALMCMGNPYLPWDVSFQLSFMATLGLILYGDRIQSGFEHLLERRLPAEQAQRIAAPVGEYFLMTLAAQSLTLPVILFHFQRLSLSSLIANPLVLPVQPLLMTLSGAAVLAGALLDPLAHALGWLAWPLSAYTIRIVELLGRVPGGAVSIAEPGLGGLSLMLLLASLPLLKDRLPNFWKATLQPAVVVTSLALLAVVALRAAMSVPDGRLHLLVFDIQGSQVILIRAPRGETLLVNSGPSANQLADRLGRWLSPFDRTIDAIILNDPAAAASRGLPAALDRFTVRQGFWGFDPPNSRTARDAAAALQNQRVTPHRLNSGEALQIGSDVRLTVLASGAKGSTLFLEYGNFRALIPGGSSPGLLPVEKRTEPALLLLTGRDLEVAPPEHWQEGAPQAVLVTGADPALALPRHWLSTRPGDWYAVTTDGQEMRIETSR